MPVALLFITHCWHPQPKPTTSFAEICAGYMTYWCFACNAEWGEKLPDDDL